VKPIAVLHTTTDGLCDAEPILRFNPFLERTLDGKNAVTLLVRAILILNVPLLLWLGVAIIHDPHFSDPLLGLHATTRLGETELRALNGGALLAFGIALAWGLFRPSRLSPGLIAVVGIAMACVSSARTLDLLLHGFHPTAAVFALTELLTALACFVQVRHTLAASLR